MLSLSSLRQGIQCHRHGAPSTAGRKQIVVRCSSQTDAEVQCVSRRGWLTASLALPLLAALPAAAQEEAGVNPLRGEGPATQLIRP